MSVRALAVRDNTFSRTRSPLTTESALRVLIVSCSKNTIKLLKPALPAGAGITQAGSSSAALKELRATAFDAVIISAGRDRAEVCNSIRAAHRGALVCITAGNRDSARAAIAAGADEVVLEPLEPVDLSVRLRVLERQPPVRLPRSVNAPADSIRFAGFELHVAAHTIMTPSGKLVVLKRADFDTLDVLLSLPGRLITREQFLARLGHAQGRASEDTFDRTIDMRIARLRRALMLADEGRSDLIVTHRDVGYMFTGKIERV